MSLREIPSALILSLLCFATTGSALIQNGAQENVFPYVPEFRLQCHPTEPIKDVPPDDPSADPFGSGPWYLNEDRSLWAAWQPLSSGERGNRIMWIKPPGLEMEISGRRLDGDAPPFRVEPNASYLNKGFEPIRLYFPTPGCWEISAVSGERELVFVVEVAAP